MAKKRNPNDATFRNITALKRRVTVLEDLSDTWQTTLARLSRELERLRERVDPVETPPTDSDGDDMLP